LSILSGAAVTRFDGERGGCAGGSVGHDQGEIGAAALFEARLGGAKLEALRNENREGSVMEWTHLI
jgi:hypothetical protein